MSKEFLGIARSLSEHVLVAQGVLRPARVWHIDPETGRRELIEDNRVQVMARKPAQKKKEGRKE